MDKEKLLEGKAAYCSYFGVLRKLTNTRQNILKYIQHNLQSLLEKQDKDLFWHSDLILDSFVGNNKSHLNVLSFGCGDGAIEVEVTKLLLAAHKTVDLTCTEPNQHYVEQAWQNFRNASLLENDSAKVSIVSKTIEDFTNINDVKYDVIILSHVLYYPEDKEEAVVKTMKLLNTRGISLIFQQAPGGLNEIQRVFSERAKIPRRCIFNCYQVEQILTKHNEDYEYKTSIFDQYLDVTEVIESKNSASVNETTMALLSFICEQDFKSQIENKPELIAILNEIVEHINRVALTSINNDKKVIFYPTAVTAVTLKYKPNQYRDYKINELTLKTATLSDLLQLQSEISPNKIFMKTISKTLSYQTTNFTVKSLATYMRQLGIKRGTRVALISPNSMAAILIVLATWKIGAVIAPLATILKPQEYLDQMNFVNVSFLFVSAQWIHSHPTDGDDLMKSFRGQKMIVNDNNSVEHSQGLDIEKFITEVDVEYDQSEIIEPQDEAAILFSSGSTSQPKAAPFTHLGIIHSAKSRTQALSTVVDAENTVLAWLPLNHVMGLVIELVETALYPGATYAVCPPLDLALNNGQNLLNGINTMGANVVSVVPYILQQWSEISGSMDTLTKMRFILFGGAPVEDNIVEYFNERSVQLVQGYGSTEAGTICISRPKHSPLMFMQMPGYKFKVDPLDLDVLPTNGGQVGELLVKGPSITQGYINNDELNKIRFTDGYYRTGDIFEVSQTHEDILALKFICRSDELLVYPNGEKFNPIRIEMETLQSSTLIHRICFVLNESKNTVAVIEPKISIADLPNLEELIFGEISKIFADLPYYARVKRNNIYVLPKGEVLPVTRKQTIMRHAVQKTIIPRLESQRNLKVAAKNSTVYSTEDIVGDIREILSDVLNMAVDQIDEEKSLIELGLSSLSVVELAEKLNKISVHVILASDLYEIINLKQLVTLVIEGVAPTALENGWLLKLNDAPAHSVKFICFPDLGGEASDFLRYWHNAPPSIQLYAVRIPNRTNFSDDPYANNLNEVVESFIRDNYTAINSTPFFFYGQCVGGLVAYEIARKFPAVGSQFKRLIVASCPSPLDYAAFKREIQSVPTFEDVKRLFSGGGFTEDDGLIDTLLRKTPIVKMAQKDFKVMRDSYKNYQKLKENQAALLPAYKITYPISVYKAIEDQIFRDDEVTQWNLFSDDTQIHLINGSHDLHTKTRFILTMYDLALNQ